MREVHLRIRLGSRRELPLLTTLPDPIVRAKAATMGNRQEKLLGGRNWSSPGGLPLPRLHFSWLEGRDILERDQGPEVRNRRVLSAHR